MDLEEIEKAMVQFLLLLFLVVVMYACTLVLVQRSNHIVIDTEEDVHADSVKVDFRYERQGKTIDKRPNK